MMFESDADFFAGSGHWPAAPADRRPITLSMRLAHRLTSRVAAKPRQLRNPAPLVSFTFDDVPDSAVTTGAALLESFGFRGTFYVATALLGRVTADWRVADARQIEAIGARGHELGLHTHSHLPLAAMSRRCFADDLTECGRHLAALTGGGRPENFAYPFGFGHLLHHRSLKSLVRSSRTTHPGINTGWADMHFLKSQGLGASLRDAALIERLLDQTVARIGWLILTAHDVAARPSPYGCTPAFLDRCIRAAMARGVGIVSVSQALDLCGVD